MATRKLTLEEQILYDIYFEFQDDEYLDCKNIEEKIIEYIFANYIDEEPVKKLLTTNEYDFIKKSKDREKIFRKLGEENSHWLKDFRDKYDIIDKFNFSQEEIHYLKNINHPLVLPRTKDLIENDGIRERIKKKYITMMWGRDFEDKIISELFFSNERLIKVIALIESVSERYYSGCGLFGKKSEEW